MAAFSILKKGFTLVELLIAMAIMMVMLVLSATAYQLYTATWQRDLSKLETSYQQFRYSELLLDAMQAILPLAVTDNGMHAYYFLGRAEGFTAVTYAPIYHTGFPAVVRVFREQNENGRYRLVYEEATLQHTVLKEASQTLPFNYRQIVAEDIPSLTFSYFGWESLTARVASQNDFTTGIDKVPQWYNEYDALSRKLHPEKIKIKLDDFALEFTIADRSRINALFANEEAI
ncbi:prepilin-type N-terminal cleavage/methylation domain-containing protein [Rheinheimera muenzenbergensis]|uniref:Prepilin-type N-terminal cleavage/methylation domain-containing protein n=1 Tax=Rheinheimera muenzenbergensis TaxID=1193628 RepID=A0ABU8C1Q7_9GAMM